MFGFSNKKVCTYACSDFIVCQVAFPEMPRMSRAWLLYVQMYRIPNVRILVNWLQQQILKFKPKSFLSNHKYMQSTVKGFEHKNLKKQWWLFICNRPILLFQLTRSTTTQQLQSTNIQQLFLLCTKVYRQNLSFILNWTF